jgi:hypothetical protein
VRTVLCPTCRRRAPSEGNLFRPFCCERCKLVDLANWADERYRVPGDPVNLEQTLPEGDDDEGA